MANRLNRGVLILIFEVRSNRVKWFLSFLEEMEETRRRRKMMEGDDRDDSGG